jgi:hypothetical protein
MLRNLARRLDQEAPGVAASILEGLDEVLSVNRLGLPAKLRRSLACTNSIENMMSPHQRNISWPAGLVLYVWCADFPERARSMVLWFDGAIGGSNKRSPPFIWPRNDPWQSTAAITPSHHKIAGTLRRLRLVNSVTRSPLTGSFLGRGRGPVNDDRSSPWLLEGEEAII